MAAEEFVISTPEALYAAFRELRKKASAGVDGVTYQMYEKDAARNILAAVPNGARRKQNHNPTIESPGRERCAKLPADGTALLRTVRA